MSECIGCCSSLLTQSPRGIYTQFREDIHALCDEMLLSMIRTWKIKEMTNLKKKKETKHWLIEFMDTKSNQNIKLQSLTNDQKMRFAINGI
jgi:hypothetical protein